MIDIANDFNLTQMVTEPTRQGNFLDLLFTSHPDLVDKVYIVPSMSDYDAVICDFNLRANPPANPKRNVYLYKRADMEGLRRTLKERFELFQASRPEAKSIRANWDHILKQTFITPSSSSYHSEHSKTKDLSHGACKH